MRGQHRISARLAKCLAALAIMTVGKAERIGDRLVDAGFYLLFCLVLGHLAPRPSPAGCNGGDPELWFEGKRGEDEEECGKREQDEA